MSWNIFALVFNSNIVHQFIWKINKKLFFLMCLLVMMFDFYRRFVI
jgi:hypothetical protein